MIQQLFCQWSRFTAQLAFGCFVGRNTAALVVVHDAGNGRERSFAVFFRAAVLFALLLFPAIPQFCGNIPQLSDGYMDEIFPQIQQNASPLLNLVRIQHFCHIHDLDVVQQRLRLVFVVVVLIFFRKIGDKLLVLVVRIMPLPLMNRSGRR